MNLQAFVGYWFIGAGTSGERASLFASYGLDVAVPAEVSTSSLFGRIGDWFWEFFER